ncbi:hypothetical protein NLJ89_g11380 [Agrocybe chaxingu]|uniref:Uncharacterized protein n=1 Tax=Agrocybe chaxingu TaxID=84603 RepID=A0A9W8MQ22_9AGAR|nr:hypothetical protein NLJ89_g11380 [Agrocybe chaxingu]
MEHPPGEGTTTGGGPTQPALTQDHSVIVPPENAEPHMQQSVAQQLQQPQEKTKDNWGKLFALAERDDVAQCDVWRDEVNNILIFVSVHSIHLSNFSCIPLKGCLVLWGRYCISTGGTAEVGA